MYHFWKVGGACGDSAGTLLELIPSSQSVSAYRQGASILLQCWDCGAGMAGNWPKVPRNVPWVSKKVPQGAEKCF